MITAYLRTIFTDAERDKYVRYIPRGCRGVVKKVPGCQAVGGGFLWREFLVPNAANEEHRQGEVIHITVEFR